MIDVYALLRPCLFSVGAEQAHNFTLENLDRAERLGLLRHVIPTIPPNPQRLCGLTFPNPVGLAAGLDKDGRHIDALARLGFGFLEIGTVTPRPQPGNPQPRMFRIPAAQALINRMGFNNDGVVACVARVRQSQFWQTGGVIGLNIGKNATTPIEDAAADYIEAMTAVYAVASYITINISSPNTANLRSLQTEAPLRALLARLSETRERLADQFGLKKPLFLKIAPDLTTSDVAFIANLLVEYGIDAVIAGNTTTLRDGVQGREHAEEMGGLSGAPLQELSNQLITRLHAHLHNQIPIIGVGGILSGKDAEAKIAAGAQLIQLYTGLIYRGPSLISACAKALAHRH
jgi:dihydroorotate dehydrogenase